MPAWNETATLADSKSLTAGTAVSALVEKFRAPVICVALEDLEGNADDTVTIEFVGAAGTYQADQRTLSATDGSDDYTVDVPQCEQIKLTSSNGVTYSAEVRANPE